LKLNVNYELHTGITEKHAIKIDKDINEKNLSGWRKKYVNVIINNVVTIT